MLKNNRRMDERLSLLLDDSANDDRRFPAAALTAHWGVRVGEVSTGRGAVASLTRGPLQAPICANLLHDLHVSARTRKVRARACGYPHLPIVPVTDAPSVRALGRMDTKVYFIRVTSQDEFGNRVLNVVRAASLLLVDDDPRHTLRKRRQRCLRVTAGWGTQGVELDPAITQGAGSCGQRDGTRLSNFFTAGRFATLPTPQPGGQCRPARSSTPKSIGSWTRVEAESARLQPLSNQVEAGEQSARLPERPLVHAQRLRSGG
jgi:hypothetical protein